MSKLNLKSLTVTLVLLTILLLSGLVLAGTLTNSSTPEPTMYSIEDIYNLIQNNTLATEGNHSLAPSSPPTSPSSYSISQIYADLANLIQRENLETGIVYLAITGDYDNPDSARPNTDIISASLTPTVALGETVGYSLADIYNLITANATTTPNNRSSTPSEAPASSLYTLSDIYEALVQLGIDMASSVKLGVTYLGVEGSYVPSVPESCPCSGWPPESWPCGGLTEEYNVTYRTRGWFSDPPCTGDPSTDETRSVTVSPAEWSSCAWWDETTGTSLSLVPGTGWRVLSGATATKLEGSTPIGAYTSDGCVSMGGPSTILDNVVVSEAI